MTFPIKGKKHRNSVLFKRRVREGTSISATTLSHPASKHGNVDRPGNRDPSSLTNHTERPGFTGSDTEAESEGNSFYASSSSPPIAKEHPVIMIPDTFTELPPLRDLLNTQTSFLQEQTIQECLPFLAGKVGIPTNTHGVPHLDRSRHVQFLHKSLGKKPSAYVAADASRPWMFYWALAGLATMGEDISSYRERIISTCRPIQNLTGGFGGGNGQMSHLAPTYAVVLSLAMVGGPEALDIIDRKAMWKWLGALKTSSGGFRMAIGGEEDIRGAYCALILITLLSLPLDLPQDAPTRSSGLTTMLDGLPEYIGRCQTFEGGIAARPDAEAHGAYAFLAVASLCILGEPHVTIPK
ncbi:hypothetical protein CJF30_00003610 [Rutstroemia sp. NJR-2017a BBW]|nr:hypothetical protein CJF30_00003610 [Rutstroemia sp. NJR-2017a BBW]